MSVPRGPGKVMSWLATGVLAGRVVLGLATVVATGAAVVEACPDGATTWSSPSSSAHAASRADAAVREIPIMPSRRRASRRVSWPSTWSRATSSARYRLVYSMAAAYVLAPIRGSRERTFDYARTVTELRWRLADDDGGQGALFEQEMERHIGRGEFRGLEF